MTWKPEDNLWKSIQRYDTYFNATNAKAAFLIAFCTFTLGVVLVQLGNTNDIVPEVGSGARRFFLGVCGALAFTTVIVLIQVMRVVVPYLRSNKQPGLYHSIIYYEDVAEHETADHFLKQVKEYDAEKMTMDLARQAHVLATGLKEKFQIMKVAFAITLHAQLPLLATLLVFLAWRRF